MNLFASEAALTSYLEPWFPSSVDYRAFDSQGRRLELLADPPVESRKVLGPIRSDNAHASELTVRAVEETPTGAGELAEVVRHQLTASGTEVETQELSLDRLLEVAVGRLGLTE